MDCHRLLVQRERLDASPRTMGESAVQDVHASCCFAVGVLLLDEDVVQSVHEEKHRKGSQGRSRDEPRLHHPD